MMEGVACWMRTAEYAGIGACDSHPLGAFYMISPIMNPIGTDDMLTLSAHLPEIKFAPGDTIIREGGAAGGIWILVTGALQVRRNGELVNTVTRPGALLGEISLLLNTTHSATVEATQPSVLRHAADGQAFLASDPAIATFVAVGLAERLNFVTTYLADLKHQYGDAPGLSMVPDVLRRLAQRQSVVVRSGSARDPDPEY
jgi:CRP/FNR family cyclic AMP-dependent transcriptional regulator